MSEKIPSPEEPKNVSEATEIKKLLDEIENLPEPNRTSKLNTVLLVCVEKGSLGDSKKVAALLGRELTVKEVNEIAANLAKRQQTEEGSIALNLESKDGFS